MKIRLLIIIGIITFPLVFQQGFSQCIYNDDWPDAPCFDMGPVSHSEFNKAWTPYYDHKGAEWMETKRIELHQAIEQGTIEGWIEKLENYNVYRYYLSRNEISSSLSYDSFFVKLDPNFITPESIDPNCPSGTELGNGVCNVIDMNVPPFNTGDCLIATASYGSKLAPQVQMLREIRDNTLLNTESGKIFMDGFNTIYYSFSPQIAQLENDNELFKEAVKIFITPMISTLSIMTMVDEGSELEVILFGASTIGIIVGMYVVTPAVLVWKIRKRK